MAADFWQAPAQSHGIPTQRLSRKASSLSPINYRLNVFGFLASEDLVKEAGGHAGNYGLMDMAAALQWVKTNIGAFGGDAGNVTIFGESAGSFAINALTAAPSARGLFNKTIGESGAFFGRTIPMSSIAERAQRDQAWVDSLGVKNLSELRSMPAEKLIEAIQKKPGVFFAPVVDGQFLIESIPETYAAGRQAHVPAIIGWNRDERSGTLSKDMTAENGKPSLRIIMESFRSNFWQPFPLTAMSRRYARPMTTPLQATSLSVHGNGQKPKPVPASRRSTGIGLIVLLLRRRTIPRANMRSTPTSLSMSSGRWMIAMELSGTPRIAR